MQSFHATVNEISDFAVFSHRNKSSTCITNSATKVENDSAPTEDKEAKPNGSAGNRKQDRPRVKSRGSSRRTRLHKASLQEQVEFTTVVRDDPHVAVIGGGMSGLICALTLEQRGIRSTVFDTGIHGLGGRMGTRKIDPYPLVFDHAAQFFTVSDPRFKKLVDGWVSKGVVKEWEGPLGKLCPGGQFTPLPPCSRYIGTNGMQPLADSLLSQSNLVNIVRPCWVSRLESFNGMWHLTERMKPRGVFDAIVIAHNGKCANSLLASAGIPLIARQMKRLELSSIWALLAAFDDPLPLPKYFEGAFIEGVDSLSWMANNTKKLFPLQSHGPHCWTFFSTAAYAKRNKVPQENIPNVKAEKVTREMLQGIEIALGLREDSLQKPFYTRVQLWGAALPTNSPDIPFIFDPYGRAGICGDWLLGSSLEAAALSGMALAHHIADYCASGGSNPDDFGMGLHKEFTPIDGHDIGQFPGSELLKEQDSASSEPAFV